MNKSWCRLSSYRNAVTGRFYGCIRTASVNNIVNYIGIKDALTSIRG